ncbi:MAG: hypothetical protein WCK82_13055 [Bacteroidota bacterium]
MQHGLNNDAPQHNGAMQYVAPQHNGAMQHTHNASMVIVHRNMGDTDVSTH